MRKCMLNNLKGLQIQIFKSMCISWGKPSMVWNKLLWFGMIDSQCFSLTMDTGREALIRHYLLRMKEDNSNLIAKDLWKFWLRKWPLKPQKAFEWVIFTNEKYLQNMVKVDLKVQFKITVMKRSWKIKSIRLRFLMFENKC